MQQILVFRFPFEDDKLIVRELPVVMINRWQKQFQNLQLSTGRGILSSIFFEFLRKYVFKLVAALRLQCRLKVWWCF
ncbi:hypothetical protein Nepgr_004859 [Nepenthes gracilis]|uniref:Uncharacterized protein n=1 Tax=Nepenthes gracilis TaxID=150966 RepID=A0AAD3S259_NEPGR|nr:hypothetical protein Nepgr_004859 [Nepenthes gracilis]